MSINTEPFGVFLAGLRTICDGALGGREAAGETAGLNLLRHFIIELFDRRSDVYTFDISPDTGVWCSCRHVGMRPTNMDPCITAGTAEAGKAPGFVKHDLIIMLRSWLAKILVRERFCDGTSVALWRQEERSHWDRDFQGKVALVVCNHDDRDIDIPLKDGEVSKLYGFFWLLEDELDAKDPDEMPKPGDQRVSTKGRVHHLAILRAHADTLARFTGAFLLFLHDPDLHVLHLCGCGIEDEKRRGACVTPSHLRFGTRGLNAFHTGVHVLLAQAPNPQAYQLCCESIQGMYRGDYERDPRGLF